MTVSVHLLLIDPQNDFCDLPAEWCPPSPVSGQAQAPALPVAGAHADMLRLARFIGAAGPQIDAISVTLDSHHRRDIAHPTFWRQGDGAPVSPFTPITAAELRAGKFQPRRPQDLARAAFYLDELETRGRYTLMVWPVHCEIGSWGHNVHAAVRAAYNAWEDQGGGSVAKLNKGSNPWTEHYSAVMAEVPDPSDAGTQLNMPFIEQLDQADSIVVAGEASSHCVRATVEHLVANLPGGKPSRLVLLTDCMSPVAGFEAQQAAFFADMAARGVRLVTSEAMAGHLRTAAAR
jgi:nicotinamidase/pyrazinamidase